MMRLCIFITLVAHVTTNRHRSLLSSITPVCNGVNTLLISDFSDSNLIMIDLDNAYSTKYIGVDAASGVNPLYWEDGYSGPAFSYSSSKQIAFSQNYQYMYIETSDIVSFDLSANVVIQPGIAIGFYDILKDRCMTVSNDNKWVYVITSFSVLLQYSTDKVIRNVLTGAGGASVDGTGTVGRINIAYSMVMGKNDDILYIIDLRVIRTYNIINFQLTTVQGNASLTSFLLDSNVTRQALLRSESGPALSPDGLFLWFVNYGDTIRKMSTLDFAVTTVIGMYDGNLMGPTQTVTFQRMNAIQLVFYPDGTKLLLVEKFALKVLDMSTLLLSRLDATTTSFGALVVGSLSQTTFFNNNAAAYYCLNCVAGKYYDTSLYYCVQCPVDHYCINNLKIPCPASGTSSVGATNINSCSNTCATGKYFVNGVCVTCQANSYCEHSVMIPCFTGYTSPPGSASVGACISSVDTQCRGPQTLLVGENLQETVRAVFLDYSYTKIFGDPTRTYGDITWSKSAAINFQLTTDYTYLLAAGGTTMVNVNIPADTTQSFTAGIYGNTMVMNYAKTKIYFVSSARLFGSIDATMSGSVTPLSGTYTGTLIDGFATSAKVRMPRYAVMSLDDTLYYFTDSFRIRTYNTITTEFRTIVGNGTAGVVDTVDAGSGSTLVAAQYIAMSPSGDFLWILDLYANLRKMSTVDNSVTTVMGTYRGITRGPRQTVGFLYSTQNMVIARDSSALYIIDGGMVKKLDLTTFVISIIVGSAQSVYVTNSLVTYGDYAVSAFNVMTAVGYYCYACVDGMYFSKDTYGCIQCQANHYCKNNVKSLCPSSGTSAVGSSLISDCSVTCTSGNYALSTGECVQSVSSSSTSEQLTTSTTVAPLTTSTTVAPLTTSTTSTSTTTNTIIAQLVCSPGTYWSSGSCLFCHANHYCINNIMYMCDIFMTSPKGSSSPSDCQHSAVVINMQPVILVTVYTLAVFGTMLYLLRR